jgi:glycosyltransferase involved in cell wall biosynthesis
LDDDALYRLLRDCRVFVSTSEVENSSVAVLEGLSFCSSVLLSDIPSHREMLNDESCILKTVHGRSYLLVEDVGNARDLQPSWCQVIETMLAAMELI